MANIKVFNLLTDKIHDTLQQFVQNSKNNMGSKQFGLLCKDLLKPMNDADSDQFAHPSLLAEKANPEENDGKTYKLTMGEYADIRQKFHELKSEMKSGEEISVPTPAPAEKRVRKRIPYTGNKTQTKIWTVRNG